MFSPFNFFRASALDWQKFFQAIFFLKKEEHELIRKIKQ
jgi:hypothetical protein